MRRALVCALASALVGAPALFGAACGGPRRVADGSAAATRPAEPPRPVGTPAAAAPDATPPAPEDALRGALVEVWEVEGELERGYEPLDFEPPTRASMWSSSAEPPAGLGASAWVARVRGSLRVHEAGPRELALELSAGARLVLDGETRLDALESNAPGTRWVVLGDLQAGEHALELVAWGNAGDRQLSLAWRAGEGDDWRALGGADWGRAGVPPATSPGPKRLEAPLARRPGGDPSPEPAPTLDVEALAFPGASARAIGLASAAPDRWLVLEGGGRAAVRIHDRAGAALAAPRTFASGLDHPGAIATGDGRVFVAQRNELSELVDRDSDGVADEYRVALELPGRDAERPSGLAVDQGLAAILFETETGVKALVASLADGRTTLHDLRSAARAFVAPGFDGAFLVLCDDGDATPARIAWVGLVSERSWSVALPAPAGARALARVASASDSARYLAGATWLAVSAAAGGFDVACGEGTAPGAPVSPVAAAPLPDGAAAFLDPESNAVQILRPAAGVAATIGARAGSDGVRLELAAPLAPDAGWERERWFVDAGGVRAPDWAALSEDRRSVALGVAGAPPTRAGAAALLADESGHAVRPQAAIVRVTLALAERPALERPQMPPGLRNTLTEEERAAGWRSLFDGSTLAGWRRYGDDGPIAGWAAENGELVGAGGGGDLVTEELFDSFELEFDWRLWPGGNSGVFFHVADGYDHVWRTGPEYQLLDDRGHADGRNPLTSAGANYALHAPEHDDTSPITAWNRARLVVDGARVEHWLNGQRQCEYELWSDDWRARVAGSKFASMPDYGLARTGRIALQDHGDRVAFKNLKLRAIVR